MTPPVLTTELVEERLAASHALANQLYADLGGLFDPIEDDPETMETEPQRHFALALSRHFNAMNELRQAGVAIDPDWPVPPLDLTI